MASNTSDLNALGLIASLAGSYLSFAGAVIVAATWPIFGLLIIWLFRSHVVGLLPFVERVEIWGAKFELKRQLAQAEQVVAATPDEPLPTSEPDAIVGVGVSVPEKEPATDIEEPQDEKIVTETLEILRTEPHKLSDSMLRVIGGHDVTGLDRAYPAVTIIDAWSKVQRLMYEAATAAQVKDRGRMRDTALGLASKGYARLSLAQLLDDLEAIYSRVMRNPISADISDAVRFASLADKASVELRSVTRMARTMENWRPAK